MLSAVVFWMYQTAPAFDPSSPYVYRANWQAADRFSDSFPFGGWLFEPSFHTLLALVALPAPCGSWHSDQLDA